jgi:protein-arginine kinase activator protein McsA
VFGPHIAELLERVHGARLHVGRLPGAAHVPAAQASEQASGQAPEQATREARLTQLRAKLAEAIRAEAYESAARLRDELRALESAPPAGS